MVIHIQLSVEPHFKDCTYGPCGVGLTANSPPPSVIAEWTFDSWSDARAWHASHGFKTDSDSIADILDNPTNEYVDTEHEVLDVTGTIYTNACISIEGQEDYG